MKSLKPVRLWKQRVSFLVDLHASRKTTIAICIAFIAVLLSASFGESFISPWKVIQAIVGQGDAYNQLLVVDFRLPRILLAAFAGMALAVAGAILQGMIKNPLASPDIIGISAGGSAAVVGFLALFSNTDHSLTVSIAWMPLAGFIGALFVGLLVYVLAWKDGVTSTRLVLIGLGVATFLQAITTMLMIMGPVYVASEVQKWLIGSVSSTDWNEVVLMVPVIAILLVVTFFLVRHLNVQDFGDDTAMSLGQPVQKMRFGLIVLSACLVGSAISFTGAIGFVGLMAPHIARRLVGSAFGLLIPTSAAIGCFLVVVADIVGRTVFNPIEVPAGVFLSLIHI